MNKPASARGSRWLPYAVGAVMAVPIAMAMIHVWKDYALFLVAFALVFGGVPLFGKAPIGRAISTALFGGILLALLFH